MHQRTGLLGGPPARQCTGPLGCWAVRQRVIEPSEVSLLGCRAARQHLGASVCVVAELLSAASAASATQCKEEGYAHRMQRVDECCTP